MCPINLVATIRLSLSDDSLANSVHAVAGSALVKVKESQCKQGQGKGEASSKGAVGTKRERMVITLCYDLTDDQIDDFLETCGRVISAEDEIDIVIDCRYVTTISQLGQIAVASVYNRLKDAGGTPTLVCVSDEVRRSLKKTKLMNAIQER